MSGKSFKVNLFLLITLSFCGYISSDNNVSSVRSNSSDSPIVIQESERNTLNLSEIVPTITVPEIIKPEIKHEIINHEIINHEIKPEEQRNSNGQAPIHRQHNQHKEQHNESPSFTGLINGFLDTLTSMSSSTTCPGRCVHPLATFMCEQVLENACPNSQSCCLNESDNQTLSHPPASTLSPSTVLSEPELNPGLNSDDSDSEEEQDDENEEIIVKNNTKNLICPGACIQARLTINCEEVLENEEFCPNQLKCCVKKIDHKHGKPEEEVDSLDDEVKGQEEVKKELKKCNGECRAMIFGLFLCDEIDHDAYCPESHQGCCVFHQKQQQQFQRPPPYQGQQGQGQRPPPPPYQGQNQMQNQGQNQGQRPPPPIQNETIQPSEEEEESEEIIVQKSSSTTTTSTLPPPTPSHPLPCPTYCLPFHLRQYCQRILNFPCGLNGFCCAHDLRPVMHPPPPPPQNMKTTTPLPISSEEEFEEDYNLETISSTTIKPEPCPGSCINAILSFTCFLNAEMTDMFTCPNPKMKCCAPKTYLTNTNTTAIPIDNKNQNQNNQNNKNVVSIGTYPKHSNNNNFNPNPNQINQIPNQMNQNQMFIQSQPPPQVQIPQQPIMQQQIQQQQIMQSIPIQQQIQPISPNQNNRNFLANRPPISRYVCGVKGTPNLNALTSQPNVNTLLSRRKRVVGGKDSLPGEWCWQVALINSLNQYLCGAALIGTEWVLTAAHCVTNIVRSGDSIYIRVGDHDLTSKYGSPGAQTLRVATTYIHHNHNSQTLDNDIALLKLQGHVALKEGVCLICLPSRNGVVKEIPGKRCTVTGYGYMGESGPIPLRVREADLPIVSEQECIRKVNAVTEKIFVLPASSFCAGGEYKNDACQGDGGGPLVCSEDGYYELTGLVSWGFGCGRQDVPGVYVKVSSFIGWINQIISVNNN